MAVGLFYRNYAVHLGNDMEETSYLTVRNAEECSDVFENPANAIYAYQNPRDNNGFTVSRSALHFDTSALPDSIVISEVKIRLNIVVATNKVCVIQSGMPDYPHNPAVAGDFFHEHYSGSEEFGPFDTGNRYVYLSEDNFSWINTTGDTKLLFRVKTDVTGDEPSGIERGLWAYNDAAHKPYIMITYEEAAAYDYPIYPVIFPLRT